MKLFYLFNKKKLHITGTDYVEDAVKLAKSNLEAAYREDGMYHNRDPRYHKRDLRHNKRYPRYHKRDLRYHKNTYCITYTFQPRSCLSRGWSLSLSLSLSRARTRHLSRALSRALSLARALSHRCRCPWLSALTHRATAVEG
jgi:hypothetical protein